MTDIPDIPRATLWRLRIVSFGGLFAGLGLLAIAATQDAPPPGLWITGGLLTAAFGWFVGSAVLFRLRHRTKEERDAARERVLMGNDGHPKEEARRMLAHEATKHKDTVLAVGRAATAVVTFVGDGHRGDDDRRLLYLELDVSAHGARPHRVRTGEYAPVGFAGAVRVGTQLAVKVDPAEPDRVAVDWSRPPGTPASAPGPTSVSQPRIII